MDPDRKFEFIQSSAGIVLATGLAAIFGAAHYRKIELTEKVDKADKPIPLKAVGSANFNNNDFDISRALKAHIKYHKDGTRTYVISDLGPGTEATDKCLEGQLVSSVKFNGLDMVVKNDHYPPDVCDDAKVTPEDFK